MPTIQLPCSVQLVIVPWLALMRMPLERFEPKVQAVDHEAIAHGPSRGDHGATG
jgi:hypothetical protein